MAARTLATAFHSTRRAIVAIALTFALLPWPYSSAPVHAEEPVVRDHRDREEPVDHDFREPDARIQIVVEEIIVNDDGDWHSSGEINIETSLHRCVGDVCVKPGLVEANIGFSADSGDRLRPNRVIPSAGDSLSADARDGVGVPLHRGSQYRLFFHVTEDDWVDFNPRSANFLEIDSDNGWQVGSHRSLEGTDSAARVTVVYQIRYAALPDLIPTNIHIIDTGQAELHCVTIENIGQRPSGLSWLAVRADGVMGNTSDLPALGVGQSTQRCINRAHYPPGEFMLSFYVDEGRDVAEINDRNNEYEHRVPALQATTPRTTGAADATVLTSVGTAPSSNQPAVAASADLVVTAIRVRGEEPSGQNDCDPGKNDITVQVKNEGAGTAASFVMHLAVEDGDDVEKAVPGLEAGKEITVTFNDVSLKKGSRGLTATVDPNKQVAETKDDNNELKVTASCQDEGGS